jgi:hypothetical protein
MSKCSKCQNDFTLLLKNNGLPYKHCDRCRCTSKKYKDAHKEHILYELLCIVLSFNKEHINKRILLMCSLLNDSLYKEQTKEYREANKEYTKEYGLYS